MPVKVRNRKSHIATAATRATAEPQCSRMPRMMRGSSVWLAKLTVCGKLKPCGSFHGPNTSQERKRLAT